MQCAWRSDVSISCAMCFQPVVAGTARLTTMNTISCTHAHGTDNAAPFCLMRARATGDSSVPSLYLYSAMVWWEWTTWYVKVYRRDSIIRSSSSSSSPPPPPPLSSRESPTMECSSWLYKIASNVRCWQIVVQLYRISNGRLQVELNTNPNMSDESIDALKVWFSHWPITDVT